MGVFRVTWPLFAVLRLWSTLPAVGLFHLLALWSGTHYQISSGPGNQYRLFHCVLKTYFLLDTTPSSALGVFNDCDCASVTRGRELADGRGNTHTPDYSLGVTFIKFLVQADSNDYAQHGATTGFWSLVCSRSSQYVNSFHFHVSHTNCPLPQDCCRWWCRRAREGQSPHRSPSVCERPNVRLCTRWTLGGPALFACSCRLRGSSRWIWNSLI